MKNTIFSLILISSFASAQTAELPEKAAEPAKVEPAKVEPPKEIAKEEVTPVEAPAKETPAKTPVAVSDDEGFNKSWNVHIDLLAGSYESMGNASMTFPNAGQYPTLTTGERIPMNEKSPTTGFQFGGGYRFSDWLSWDMNVLILAAKQDSKITTSTGATHDVKLETGFMYFSPLTWTGYPVRWLYLQAGVGLVVEAHRVTTTIPNIGNFETGSYGGGFNLGTGVEFALSKMFSLRGGLTFISAPTVSQEKKINEGQAAEVNAKWEERKIGIGLLSFGTKFYF
jgi:Outer membrane protein beta-barrel domain